MTASLGRGFQVVKLNCGKPARSDVLHMWFDFFVGEREGHRSARLSELWQPMTCCSRSFPEFYRSALKKPRSAWFNRGNQSRLNSPDRWRRWVQRSAFYTPEFSRWIESATVLRKNSITIPPARAAPSIHDATRPAQIWPALKARCLSDAAIHGWEEGPSSRVDQARRDPTTCVGGRDCNGQPTISKWFADGPLTWDQPIQAFAADRANQSFAYSVRHRTVRGWFQHSQPEALDRFVQAPGMPIVTDIEFLRGANEMYPDRVRIVLSSFSQWLLSLMSTACCQNLLAITA